MDAPPTFESLDSYAAHLGDVQFWAPYAQAALASAGLAEARLTSGFEGTYPTLVGQRLVVKLFGHFPGWRESLAGELAANQVIQNIDSVHAPTVIASGSLFPDSDHSWPFLISQRQRGEAWRDARPTAEVAHRVAWQLGTLIRALHDHVPATGPPLRPDWISAHGHAAAERHRTWGSLPAHLVDQIPDYLVTYNPGSRRCLVHGDLTEDHLFIDGDELAGVIDWGDAMVTDPFYDLAALHLGAFAGDARLLGSFLGGYGWRVDQDFADRALQVALMHEFDLFGEVAAHVQEVATLAEVANELWTVPASPHSHAT